MAKGVSKLRWLPGAATALAIVFCYGTALLIGLLSLLGVSLAIDDRVWAGAISLFATLAVIFIAILSLKRRVTGPTAVAGVGLACILWAMCGIYSRAIELVGFALLVAATLWNWQGRPSAPQVESDVSWIDAADLADRFTRKPRPMVIDVRGPDEFNGELGHLKDARNIPIGEFPQRVGELTRFKTDQVALVCRTQMRSAMAAATLKEVGFHDVTVLRGGMVEWVRQNRPVEKSTAMPV